MGPIPTARLRDGRAPRIATSSWDAVPPPYEKKDRCEAYRCIVNDCRTVRLTRAGIEAHCWVEHGIVRRSRIK
jgi:hypothetical protein